MSKNTIDKNSLIKVIFAEPYVYFFGIGLVLYIFYQNFSSQESMPTNISTVIENANIDEINRSLATKWNRRVRQSELDLMLKKHYYDEVLLKEAIINELEKKDPTLSAKSLIKVLQDG